MNECTWIPNSDQRFYASSYGRFNSADPTAANISFEDPRTWNLYSYTGGDPINSNDPSGLCSVFIARITQGYDEGSAFTQIANAAGAGQAYPYSGLGPITSIMSVAQQSVQANAATGAALAAITDALSKNSGTIDIVAYSGGSAAFTAAYGLLSVTDRQRIGNIVYVSPGAAGELATNGNTTVVLGSDWKGVGATVGTYIPPGTPITDSQCGHQDFACLVRAAQSQFSLIQSNGACWSSSSPGTPRRGGGGGADNGGSNNPVPSQLKAFSQWVGAIPTTLFWSETIFRPDRN